MKRIIALAGLLLLAALTAQAARPRAITRASFDLNRDGKRDTITIRMTSGKYYGANDPADGSCASGSPKYSGKFSIEVRLSGKKPVSQSLNALIGGFDDLEFWAEPWRIVFDDYNQDRQMDFNLGQFVNCSGWVYWLFTIAPDGHISQLEVEEGNPHSEIFAGDDSNSTRLIRSTPNGFYTKGYYNGATPIGFYTSYYIWNAKKRSFIYEKDVYDRLQSPSGRKPHWARGG